MAKFCKNCGTPIEEGAGFCPGCGAAVQAPQAQYGQATPPPTGPPAGTQHPYQGPQAQYGQATPPPADVQPGTQPPYQGPQQQYEPPPADVPPGTQPPYQAQPPAYGPPPADVPPEPQPPYQGLQQQYGPPPASQQPNEPPAGYVPQQPYAPPPGQAYAAPPAKKKPKWLLIVIIAVAAVVALAVIGSIGGDTSDGATGGNPATGEPSGGGIGDNGTSGGDAGDDGTTGGGSGDDGTAGGITPTKTAVPERGGFTDYPVVVGEGTEFPLNGMLSIPDNIEGKAPAVVLVQGAGQFNMDEEVAPNKAFRDIAEYLASYGIAVIRYDKRNFEHNAKMKETFGGSLTLEEDVVEDALRAVEILKADPRVDEDRVFIVGHSLGGCIAPRAHTEGGGFAGIISLASTPVSPFDLSDEQRLATIVLMPEGEEKEEALAQLEYYNAEYYRHAVMSLSEDEAKDTPFAGYSAYYYQDWENNIPARHLDRTNIPFLILQGTKDFMVSAELNYTAWQDLLAGRDDATFILYEGLNHFFMPFAGGSIVEWEKEFAAPAHTDEQVLADIVEWIYSQ